MVNGRIGQVGEELEDKYRDHVNIFDSIGPTGRIIITITAKAATKGAALAAACAELGIAQTEVVSQAETTSEPSYCEPLEQTRRFLPPPHNNSKSPCRTRGSLESCTTRIQPQTLIVGNLIFSLLTTTDLTMNFETRMRTHCRVPRPQKREKVPRSIL